jgi:DNA helicase-2/ATP-dependent DNA helicase PcrA
MALTPSQKAAVLYDKNLILFAGPGSGKTATSVAKGRRILEAEDNVLCMITFTTAAAQEMRDRMGESARAAGRVLPKNRLTVGTFHALALRHYQRHSRAPQKLLAPPARSAMVNAMLRHLEPEQRASHLLALERYQGALNQEAVDLDVDEHKFVSDYSAKMTAAHAIDLSTVMRECTMRMRSGVMPLLGVSHLLGDEMQDADEVQLEFMLAHADKGVITTLVADDDQTIYEWRCALGYAGLQKFAVQAKAKTITLAENFRSRTEIVEHARILIAHNDPSRIQKVQTAVRGPGGALAVRGYGGLVAECEIVAATIEMHRQPGESVAVLARTNWSLQTMEQKLSALGIAYVRDGQSLWDTEEVGTFVSLLKALLSSKSADLLPVLMQLEIDKPLRRELEVELGPDCHEFLDGLLPSLSCATPTDIGLLGEFVKETSRWRRDLRSGAINAAIPGIADFLGALYKHGHGQAGEASRTKRSFALLDAASEVVVRLPGLLSQRLNAIANLKNSSTDREPVRLITMHSSKGLEFDTVFLIDASHPDDGSTLMEDHPERRLFYVALTRAKNRFCATYHGQSIKYIQEAELPFVQDLGAALYGGVTPPSTVIT